MQLLLWLYSSDTKSKIWLENFCQNFDFVLGERNEVVFFKNFVLQELVLGKWCQIPGIAKIFEIKFRFCIRRI